MGYLNSFSYDDEDFAATAAANGTTEPPEPSWSSGLLGAVPRGLVSAFGKTLSANGLLGPVGPGPGSMAPEVETTEGSGTAGNPFQDYSKIAPEVSKAAGDAIADYAKPNPVTQGAAAQMVQGLTEGAALGIGGAAATGSPIGGAVLMGGVEGASTYSDMRKQGVDHDTAVEEGLISGAVSAAGAFIPMRFAGSGLLTSLLTGAGVNTVLSAAQRGATGAVLQAHGYDQMASQYKVLDWNAAVSDALLGAVFGGVGKVMHGVDPKEVLPSDVDQAQAIQSEQHLTRDGALGIPTDPQTEALHAQTAQDTLEGLALRGETPDIQPDHAELLAKDLVADPRKDDAAPPALDEQFMKELPWIDLETAEPKMRPEAELAEERIVGADSAAQAVTDKNPLAALSTIALQQAGDLGPGGTLREGHVPAADWEILKDAGLVEDIPNPDGTTFPGVSAHALGVERDRRAAAAKAAREPVSNEEKARGVDRRADNYARIAKEQEDLGELGNADTAKEMRAREVELRAQAESLRRAGTNEAPQEAAPSVDSPQAGEARPQGPQISGIHQEMLSQLEQAHGDMPIDFGDGQTRTVADVRQMLADNGVQVQKDSALHDVAAACFIRGM